MAKFKKTMTGRAIFLQRLFWVTLWMCVAVGCTSTSATRMNSRDLRNDLCEIYGRAMSASPSAVPEALKGSTAVNRNVSLAIGMQELAGELGVLLENEKGNAHPSVSFVKAFRKDALACHDELMKLAAKINAGQTGDDYEDEIEYIRSKALLRKMAIAAPHTSHH